MVLNPLGEIHYRECIRSRIVAREFIDLRCLRHKMLKYVMLLQKAVFFSAYLLIVEEWGKEIVKKMTGGLF